MGFYDRDYQRDDYYQNQPGFNLRAPTTMTVRLVVVTCAVYVAQLLSSDWVTNVFELQSDWFRRPWQIYQLLTYGFLHSPADLWHIALNMYALWLFGRELEYRYGQREFLAFYLVSIVVAGLVWSIAELPMPAHAMLGASGGVTAVVILFALNYPHQSVLFMMVLPMKMWVLALIIVGLDAYGAIQRSGDVAFTCHLGGAAFAFLYYKRGWRLERLLPSHSWKKSLRPKPKLRIVDAEEDDNTENRVDEILKKIQEQGQDSLTRGERRILEKASREYQKRRH